ncbi:MAG TPA: hypothetical protein VM884_10915 [Flavisolibacter sp.]|nr:hypothetical protein [Flavisolibacter sp.]
MHEIIIQSIFTALYHWVNLGKSTFSKFDTALIIALLILYALCRVLLIAVMFPFSTNMFLYYWNKKNALQFTTSVPLLPFYQRYKKLTRYYHVALQFNHQL